MIHPQLKEVVSTDSSGFVLENGDTKMLSKIHGQLKYAKFQAILLVLIQAHFLDQFHSLIFSSRQKFLNGEMIIPEEHQILQAPPISRHP